MNFYNKACDTLILADCFEDFRSMSKTEYDLDPLNFSTSPGMTWAACLKYTKVELELTRDIETALFIDNCLIGG